MREPGTIVIGAGIIGASIAYHLATQGESVTVIEAGLPASGATGQSFAWISSAGDPNTPAGQLRRLSHDDWIRLSEEIEALDVHWTGSLTLGDEFGRDGSSLVSDARTTEPGLLEPPPHGQARFSPEEGWIDPVLVTEQLLEAARTHGAQVRLGEPAVGLVAELGPGIVGVHVGNETLRASTIVVAAGTGSPALCRSVGVEIPLISSPAVIVRLDGPPGLVDHIVACDEFEVRQDSHGRLLMPLDWCGENTADELAATGENARRVLIGSFDGASNVRVHSVEVGWRPMPKNGQPLVGTTNVSGISVAIAHPGVCLAAPIGRLLAEEIVTSTPSPLLSRLRPTSA